LVGVGLNLFDKLYHKLMCITFDGGTVNHSYVRSQKWIINDILGRKFIAATG